MGERLLVRYARIPGAARSQGNRQHSFAADLGEAGNTACRNWGEGLRLRPVGVRDLGDYGGGGAGVGWGEGGSPGKDNAPRRTGRSFFAAGERGAAALAPRLAR